MLSSSYILNFFSIKFVKTSLLLTKQWNFENMNIAKVNDNSSRGGKTTGVLHLASNDCTCTKKKWLMILESKNRHNSNITIPYFTGQIEIPFLRYKLDSLKVSMLLNLALYCDLCNKIFHTWSRVESLICCPSTFVCPFWIKFIAWIVVTGTCKSLAILLITTSVAKHVCITPGARMEVLDCVLVLHSLAVAL